MPWIIRILCVLGFCMHCKFSLTCQVLFGWQDSVVKRQFDHDAFILHPIDIRLPRLVKQGTANEKLGAYYS